MQSSSVVESCISYLQIVAFHLKTLLLNHRFEVLLGVFRNGHLLYVIILKTTLNELHCAHFSRTIMKRQPHGNRIWGIDGPVEIILMPGCFLCL